MSEERAFNVPGSPQGKGRPRATIRAGHAAVYTPQKTAAYENLIAMAYSDGHGAKPPFKGPVKLTLYAYFPYAKSDYWPVNGKHNGELREEALSKPMVKKPDLDNVVKAVLDGLNQAGAWLDDSQVDCIYCHKGYCSEPHLFVSLEGEE